MGLKHRIGELSGGQKARVVLAMCLLSGASVILLDAPTNNLDLTSTQVMEPVLVYFPGAIVVVSHDRFFIIKVATRLLVFEGIGRLAEAIRIPSPSWKRQDAAPLSLQHIPICCLESSRHPLG
jgi:ATPase subunit of ABC transporter with duplicated ATPase domains